MRDLAQQAVDHGISVVPARMDGTKRPAGEWKQYQLRHAAGAELDAWFGPEQEAIGVICGKVSGGLEMLEFEGRAVQRGLGSKWRDSLIEAGHADLYRRVTDGYTERTPSGGIHILYRSEQIEGNKKLAHSTDGVLIETRGEGGFVVISPTTGNCHPTGNPWKIIKGGFATIATITEDERAILHQHARLLDETPLRAVPDAPYAPQTGGDDERPGDRYNNDPDALKATYDLLIRHGWQHHHQGRDGEYYLTRPGKPTRDGWSATLAHPKTGGQGFYVFTTSDQFEAEHSYTPFQVLTILEHGGDYSAAARALVEDDPTWDVVVGNKAPGPIVQMQPAIEYGELDNDDEFPIPTYRAPDILPLADVPLEWMIRRVLVNGTYGLLGGAQKSLKTELGVALDLAVLTGTPLLGDSRFDTPEAAPVISIMSEGGLRPYMRRVKRWASALGLDDIPLDDYIVGFGSAPLADDKFLHGLGRRIERHEARLVRLDALYGFHGGNTEGQNVFAMGDLLTKFSNLALHYGATGLITHHFNETGSGSELTRFAMAGAAQWVDSWVTIVHRTPPKPDQGEFNLGLRIGSRQWGESAWAINMNLGTFDAETSTHVGEPTWTVEQAEWEDVARWGRRNPATATASEDSILIEVKAAIGENPWETQRTYQATVPRSEDKVAKAIKTLLAAGEIQMLNLDRWESHRYVKRDVYGPRDAEPPMRIGGPE